MKTRNNFAALGVALTFTFPLISSHAADCQPAAGRLVSVQGVVEIASGNSQQWHGGKLDESLCQGDTIRVGERSRAAVALINDAVLRIDQNTTLRLTDISAQEKNRSLLDLVKGAFQSFIRKPRQLSINTPYLNGSIEGTEFVFRVDDNKTDLTVFEGTVVASNEQGRLAVPGGGAVTATKDQAPQTRVVVKPRNEVQWALYYPPVLALGGAASGDATSDLQKAAQLLEVGRIDEARPIIDRVIAADPNAGAAYALRAVIEVTQNQITEALADGEKAASLDKSTAGSIALSYAQQASFRIVEARDTLRTAVNGHPEDALAWARLAELELMLGNRDTATTTARKAEALAPNLARSQLVLGFAELSQYHKDQAKAAFERAIQLESADPLAHLGLGLTKISAGDLQGGRHDIEIAVGLDGSSALLRAYLGKAYFEERRAELDVQQFVIAKELDPNDPTAFLYDGIRKQTENRPVEALADLEQSIALNDNRAVYRSRLLLDKDRASRGTSVARAYNDLGFTGAAVAEAARSLSADPANAAAHRFLSDAYQGERRREIARVSELLQAQMLQDVNIAPIQPSTSEANLNIAASGGPANAGFNEFTPLFQRNQVQAVVSAFGGNNATKGAEAALSGLHEKVSFGLSALSYETDGWRPNNGLKHTLYNFFEQVAISDRANVQVEFRRRESTEGDLAFNFNPDDFLANKTIKRQQDTARLGVQYSPAPQTHILLSYVHSQRNVDRHEVQELPPVTGVTTFTANRYEENEANQFEAQILHNADPVSFIAGAARSKPDQVDDVNVSVDDSVDGNLFTAPSQEKTHINHSRAYVYTNTLVANGTRITLGVSYDDFEHDIESVLYKKTSFNPKLGIQWDASPDVQFRAAAFQVIKPALVSNRTLEPTQVAGINQLFDDINGTQSRGHGLALDWRASRDVRTGVELTRRTLDEPTFRTNYDPILDVLINDWITEERNEQWHRLYLDWTPFPRLAVHTALVYDQYRSDTGILTSDGNLPEKVVTRSVPINVSYFDSTGYFAGLGATGVDQSVQRSATAIQASGDDRFVVVDASIGYRFAKRHGVLSLAVKNLFDRDFKYQDDSYREFRDEPATGPYFPVRTVMARGVVNF